VGDLVVSAATQVAALMVLHYDADFERIATAGAEWVRRMPP